MRLGLHALAFGAGFAVMTIEIAGARVIAPVFGLSAVSWTAVIGVILTALALGRHLGGRLADEGRIPLSLVLATAGATAFGPVLGGGLPWWAAANFGYVLGAVVSAAVLFAPPVLALGTVVPYLVKADTRSLETVGRRAGDLSASATLGSIVGTFATGFLLLPLLPLPMLLGTVAALLFLLAALSSAVMGEAVRPGPLLLAAALAVSIAPWRYQTPVGQRSIERRRSMAPSASRRPAGETADWYVSFGRTGDLPRPRWPAPGARPTPTRWKASPYWRALDQDSIPFSSWEALRSRFP